MAVVDMTEYKEKVTNILADKNNYEELANNPKWRGKNVVEHRKLKKEGIICKMNMKRFNQPQALKTLLKILKQIWSLTFNVCFVLFVCALAPQISCEN